MARLVYSLLFYLLTPFIFLRLLWRSRRAPGYRKRWGERLGYVTPIAASSQVIWVHSVSVGETLAAVPMIKALQQRYPDALLAVTTMTPTGSARVKAEFGDSVYHVYAPYDLPCAVNRFLRRVRPQLLVIMETELWPNLIHCCRQHRTPVVVANARLSEKSAKGYRRFSALTAPMLAMVNRVAAQHVDDGARFQSLGLSDEQLTITGNIKFDLSIDEPLKQRAGELRGEWRGREGRSVWLVASTHAGEEEIVLRAFRQLLTVFPSLLLVLVPRHPERFQDVAQLCEAHRFRTVKRSLGGVPGEGDQILLGDTMGELLIFFGACDIAFVGGSLVPVGGHNLIEPAAWQKPVLSGPHLFNFSEASRLLLEAGGMAICADDQALAGEVRRLLESPESAESMATAAKQVADNNRGALQRLLDVIEHQLESQ